MKLPRLSISIANALCELCNIVQMMDRRQFLLSSLSAASSAASAIAARAPIKIAHREGNMLRESSPGVYELAASIGGIYGIEVQTVRSNLWSRDVALAYK